VSIGEIVAGTNGKSIAVDAQNVYWTERGGGDGGPGSFGGNLKVCPKTGCVGAPALLATDLDGADQVLYDPNIGRLFLGSSGINVVDEYDVSGQQLFRVQAANQVASVAVDANFLYFNSGNTIVRSTKDGATQTTIADGLPTFVVSLAVDPTTRTVFAALGSDSGSIVQTATSPPSTRSWSLFGPQPQRNPQSIAVGQGNVYWANLGTAASGMQDGGVYMCPTTGCSQATALLAPATYGASIVTDATDAYFIANSSVYRCPLGGCAGAPTLLSRATAAAFGGPSLTQDETSLYWIPILGPVSKLAK
jgi:hypothetical protein